jgi:hypothetical protein
MMGRIENVLRLPLVPLADAHAAPCAPRSRGRPIARRMTIGPVVHPAAELERRVAARPRRRRPARRSRATRRRRRAAAHRARARRRARGRARRRRHVARGAVGEAGILLGFRVGRMVDMSPPAAARIRRSSSSTSTPSRRARSGWSRRCASCPAARRSAAAPTWRRAWCACRRCTSTSAPTSAPARWSTRTRSSARARRSASACT